MISEIGPAPVAVPGLTHGSQSPAISQVHEASGNNLPQSRQAAAATVAAQSAAAQKAAAQKAAEAAGSANSSSIAALVARLNKYLNDSGQPYQFRIDPQSADKLIQEVNPANGEVLGEFSASEFPTLAQSIAGPGLLVDTLA